MVKGSNRKSSDFVCPPINCSSMSLAIDLIGDGTVPGKSEAPTGRGAFLRPSKPFAFHHEPTQNQRMPPAHEPGGQAQANTALNHRDQQRYARILVATRHLASHSKEAALTIFEIHYVDRLHVRLPVARTSLHTKRRPSLSARCRRPRPNFQGHRVEVSWEHCDPSLDDPRAPFEG